MSIGLEGNIPLGLIGLFDKDSVSHGTSEIHIRFTNVAVKQGECHGQQKIPQHKSCSTA